MAKVLVGPARELRPHFAALAAPYGFAGAQSIDGVGPKAIGKRAVRASGHRHGFPGRVGSLPRRARRDLSIAPARRVVSPLSPTLASSASLPGSISLGAHG